MSIPLVFCPSGPVPLATSPFSFKSMYQLSICPSLFLSVNANIALPFLMASLRSASSDRRESLIRSNASDEGKASTRRTQCMSFQR